MILTGNEIKLQREAGNIIISDWDETRLGPNSYNLRLSPELMAYKEAVLDPKQDNRTGRLMIPEEGLVLHPGRLYLAKTMEYTETHNLVPMLVGRSSLAAGILSRDGRVWRCGLFRELDLGTDLRAAGAGVPRHGDLPNLLSDHHRRDFKPVSRKVPGQPGCGGQPDLSGVAQ